MKKQRKLLKSVEESAKKFPVIYIGGPRQCGKTTLSKMVFPNYHCVNLEDPESRSFAANDPKGFLKMAEKTGLIIDEVQRVPELFSSIQVHVDQTEEMGKIILTGSQNFLLLEAITQSLAGRVRLFQLLPFSLAEAYETNKIETTHWQAVAFSGLYPPINTRKVSPTEWYAAYIETYVERDVRLIQNIKDLRSFRQFIQLCAGRSGKPLNLTELGNDCGVSHNTAKSWLSILEASYLIYIVPPHHNNFNKRIVKQPKLYFLDSGLLCYLLNIKQAEEINAHWAKGEIFETLIFTELLKAAYFKGEKPNISFWQSHNGRELDFIIEKNQEKIAVEIKAGSTISESYLDNIKLWQKLDAKHQTNYIVYGGLTTQNRTAATILPWYKGEII